MDYSSLVTVTGACHAPVACRQGKALADTAPRIPVSIEKSADLEMDGSGESGGFSRTVGGRIAYKSKDADNT